MPRRVEAGPGRCALSIFVLVRTNITQKERKVVPVLNRARRNESTKGIYTLGGGEWSALHSSRFFKGTR
jgi:hypothetical protein